MSMDRATRSRIIRNGVLALASLVAISLLARYQAVQNPRYESSLAYVKIMEEAFRNLEAGLTEVDDYPDEMDGFAGFRLGDPPVRGLIGENGGACYVIWQRPGVGAGAGVLQLGLLCVADSRLEFSQSYGEQMTVVPAGSAPASPIRWDPLLPPSGTPGWFVLAIVLLIWAGTQLVRNDLYRHDPPSAEDVGGCCGG
jgi:hypothetical protein